ncbi:holA: DNA polymerase III, delta subunit [Rubrobacter radiotolerans]|uniref:DNA polymerase III subunit delta n=1 Tax=Rubrobacter radiotolerans TaxID=42256 RepID=A0A023X391_RUBRA|nr:DNA polymerase III subunit delta [Rubrobacter radiotolerans]AHY46808.1 holA: DNA polymerase III, delta subunit [Rubrobacter radiotolerans]MDX5894215.1 DNA polymerase III subunit delta [Rubrobacter radiotolerans]SMC05485.1 DNA polymerase III, delta subunit [Rubrobacter radiotolerans DSM 5868]
MTVYLLYGDDEERKARSVEKLRAGRGSEVFDASTDAPEAVLAACNSFSLFGEATFVLLRNLDAWNAAQKAKLLDYVANPSEGSDLVMLAQKMAARDRLLTATQKSGEAHELKQPTGKALERWLIGHAKRNGLAVSVEVAQELMDRCSSDKARLVNEVEKLSLFCEGGEVTLGDVDALVAPDVQSNIFEFVDALGAGRTGRAIETLDRLAATGEPPLRVLFMVRRQLQLIARAKSLAERGVPRPEVAGALKVPPFVAKKLDEQGRRFTPEDLERALETVLDLEGGLKGGSDLPDALQLERAVVKLTDR